MCATTRRRVCLRIILSIGLGSTVSELDVSDAKVVLPKTKFSMYLPEIAQSLKETEIKSVILFGIEVQIFNHVGCNLLSACLKPVL